MTLQREKKKFLAQVLGEERADALENATGTLAKELEREGVGWKDAPTSFAEADVQEAFGTFSMIVANVLARDDLQPDERVQFLEDAVHALGDRLGPVVGSTAGARKEAGRFLRRSLDAALEQLTVLASKDMGAPDQTIVAAGRVVAGALHDRVSLLFDNHGRVKALSGAGLATAYVSDLLGPKRSAYPLARAWEVLGLDGATVAAALKRQDGSKQRGATHTRLYQLLASGDADARVIEAIARAGLDRGRSPREVKAALKAVGLTGQKSASAANPAQPYVNDLLSGRAAHG